MKQYRVGITLKAEGDIDDVMLFSGHAGDPTLAEWHSRIIALIESLSNLPFRFPEAPEARGLKKQIRICVFGKRRGAFKIYYEVECDEVRVIRVLRGARNRLTPDDLA